MKAAGFAILSPDYATPIEATSRASRVYCRVPVMREIGDRLVFHQDAVKGTLEIVREKLGDRNEDRARAHTVLITLMKFHQQLDQLIECMKSGKKFCAHHPRGEGNAEVKEQLTWCILSATPLLAKLTTEIDHQRSLASPP